MCCIWTSSPHRLSERLRALGREAMGVRRIARRSRIARLYEPDPQQAWKRLRGLNQLPPTPRARARVLAVWRERLARERDLPRGWIISDAALFKLAEPNPATRAALGAVPSLPANLNDTIADSLLEALRADAGPLRSGPAAG